MQCYFCRVRPFAAAPDAAAAVAHRQRAREGRVCGCGASAGATLRGFAAAAVRCA